MSDVNKQIDHLLPDSAAIAQLANSMAAENSGEVTHDLSSDASEPAEVSAGKPALEGMAGIPAKPAVYACFLADGTPIIAATTANLRNALKNRISNQTPAGKRINYAEIADTIRFRRVGSAFAASWWYYRTVRTLFPRGYASMLAWKPAWFVTLNPDAEFPHFTLSNKLAEAPAVNVGPLLSRHKARSVVESIEDLFDLCRYYDILRQAPNGNPCAYKELGKCPAPCDGSIPMLKYRQQINAAVGFLSDSRGARTRWFDDQTQRIRQAASNQDFRLAAAHKRKLDQADKLADGKLTEVQDMDKWKYLIIQRGKTANWIAPFVAGPGWIVPLAEVQDALGVQAIVNWMKVCRQDVSAHSMVDVYPVEEVAALVTYHKYRPRDAGLYIPVDEQMGAEIIAQAIQFWLNHKGDYDMPEINSANPSAALTADQQPNVGSADQP